jgi:tetratricopeptide (TPR) repeat protein
VLIERAVAHRESRRLEDLVDPADSRLHGALARDLSNIVRKCLAASPEDRFSSVRELAADLDRYLKGMPMMARPQTGSYRLSKFVRRNPGKVALACALSVAQAGSAGYAWRQQQKAIEEGQRAQQMQTFLYRLFQAANSNVTGKPAATLTEFLRLGIKVLPDYIKDPHDLRQAELGLAESMFQNRDYEGALPVLNRVMQDAKRARDLPAEAEAATYLCNIDYAKGLGSAGLQQCARAVDLAKHRGVPARTLALAAANSANMRAELGLIGVQPTFQPAEMAVKTVIDNRLPPHETGQAILLLANLYQIVGQLEKARGMFEQALVYFRKDPPALCDQSDVYFGLAGITRMSGHIPDSVPLYRKALDLYTTCSGPGDRETLRMGAYYAGAMAESGKEAEAVSFLEAAGLAWKKTFEPESSSWREYWHYLEVAYLSANRFADAEHIARINLAFSEKWSKDPAKDRVVGVENFQLATALAKQGRNREALTHAELAEKILAPTTVSEGAKKVLAQVRDLEKSLK